MNRSSNGQISDVNIQITQITETTLTTSQSSKTEIIQNILVTNN